MKKLRICVELLLVVLVSGCANGSSLRARSAGDMHCPAETLLIHRVDDRTYRVNGCEQEIVYISSCERPAESQGCTWVANTTTSGNAASNGASGCSFDNQCKGDRICVNKACVAPPPAANAAP